METQSNAQGVMRFVPTAAKLRRMREVTRPVEFRVSGSRALSVIGLLVCIIGIQGFVHSRSGSGQARRAVVQSAPADNAGAAAVSESVPGAAGTVATASTGGFARSAGLFAVVIGLLIALKPHVLHYELKRLGVVRQPGGAGQY